MSLLGDIAKCISVSAGPAHKERFPAAELFPPSSADYSSFYPMAQPTSLGHSNIRRITHIAQKKTEQHKKHKYGFCSQMPKFRS